MANHKEAGSVNAQTMLHERGREIEYTGLGECDRGHSVIEK